MMPRAGRTRGHAPRATPGRLVEARGSGAARAPYTGRMNQIVHSSPRPRRARPATTPTGRPTRTNDPARTMAGILQVATAEFGEKGLDGARIDAIAAATQTSKRMIYYYFGSKEGLYLAVLEDAYRRMRETEAALNLDNLPPVDALRRLVEFTFDHHQGNPDYIRLVMSENMQRAQYMAQSPVMRQINEGAIESVRRLYERGVREGVFRAGLDPVDIHASISALSFFNVSNQHTFGLIFQFDTQSPVHLALRRASIVEMIVRFVRAP